MIPGWVLLGELPLASLPDEDSLATVSVETVFLTDPDADAIFLLELTPTGGSMLRLSDVGYITTASDTPASTPYRDRLLSPYNIDVRIPPPDAGTALGELAFGVIEIESGDDELDALLVQSSEGCDALVKVVGTYHVDQPDEGTLTFAQAQAVQRGTVSAVGWQDGRIILTLRERLQELSEPLQTETYAGTGGLEGDETLKGHLKPYFAGKAFNWEPTLVDAARQIYQWSSTPVNSVTALRDKGYGGSPAFVYDGDVADIEAGTPPIGGHYRTQNSEGYLQVGGIPEGRLTLDGEGDKTGGVYVSTPAEVVQRMAARVGLVSADFEAGSFTGFPVTGTVGIGFRDEAVTALEGIGRLLAGVFGWVSQSRNGLLRVGRFNDPDTSTPEVTITDDVIESLEDGSERPPVWKVEIEYGINWTPQDPDALSDALTVAERSLYSEPFRLASAEDAAVKTAHVDARIFRLTSYLTEAAEAEALADLILTVLKRRVRNYVVGVEREMFRRQPNAVVRVESALASDLTSGRNLLAISVAEDAPSRLNRWELWG